MGKKAKWEKRARTGTTGNLVVVDRLDLVTPGNRWLVDNGWLEVLDLPVAPGRVAIRTRVPESGIPRVAALSRRRPAVTARRENGRR